MGQLEMPGDSKVSLKHGDCTDNCRLNMCPSVWRALLGNTFNAKHANDRIDTELAYWHWHGSASNLTSSDDIRIVVGVQDRSSYMFSFVSYL
jgi:hypothetical protein